MLLITSPLDQEISTSALPMVPRNGAVLAPPGEVNEWVGRVGSAVGAGSSRDGTYSYGESRNSYSARWSARQRTNSCIPHPAFGLAIV